ncbi:MAG: hypothetical protein HY033_02770 [Ignavibacteriae bacterium]|nr:hypothetical protein [Ignavibacteria bacterium]MBI3363810.1 hypothetical protein [Ignavibacteriota bacterium]
MALPLAVADTSVLIHLHHLGLLEYLSHLYSGVLVPSPVRTEFLRRDKNGARELALNVLTTRGLFTRCDDYDSNEVDLLRTLKMKGAEAEALSQLKKQNADVLLIDEKIGRSVAERERRSVKGTIGILASFSRLEFVEYFPAVERLRKELSFRISDEVVREALEKTGEGFGG